MTGFKRQGRQIGLFGCGKLPQLQQGITAVVVGSGTRCFLIGCDGLPIGTGSIPGVAAPDGTVEGAGGPLKIPLLISLHRLQIPPLCCLQILWRKQLSSHHQRHHQPGADSGQQGER